MAAQLIAAPPKGRPKVKGLEPIFGRLPKNINRQWLLDVAWKWRDSHVTPEGRLSEYVLTKTGGDRVNLDGVMAVVGQDIESVESRPFRLLTEAQLQEIEKVAPQTAAEVRREVQEIKDAERRSALTRTIARIQQLIVDQYGKWDPRD